MADADPVAGDARQPAPLRPAPVAVHDDGDVRRDSFGIESQRQFPIPSLRSQRFQHLHAFNPSYTVAQSSGEYKVPYSPKYLRSASRKTALSGVADAKSVIEE